MYISTESVITNHEEDPIVLQQDDLIIDYFKDEKDTILPIIMKLERSRGLPWSKQIVMKKYELSLDFSNQPTEVQDKINEWIDSIENV